jgi:glyoxylase-like metal-dependent hydrolase (beta-lactamase superfamily II)
MLSAPRNIHKITLPTGFPIGDVNIYLIKDDPVTLIDTGVNGAISEHLLSRNLEELGLSIEDIKRIVLTHTHLDHCGLAGRLQELSGAEVLIFSSCVEEIKNFNQSFSAKPRLLKNFYIESAVPESLLSRSLRLYQKSITLGSSVKEAKPLKENDVVASENYKFKVLHTPGHSQDMICLYERNHKILFSSDHITLHTNPSLRLREVFAERNGNLGNMEDYFKSLSLTKELDVDLTLPGHGETFTNPSSTIDRIREIYCERKETVAEILIKNSLNRFELARALFGFLNDREIFKGIPEVIGHLEVLENEGRLTKWETNGVIYYSATREAKCLSSR